MKRKDTLIDDFMAKYEIKNDTQLAYRLGLSKQVMHHRLKGNISVDTLSKIASYFKVSVKEILR